VPLCLAGVADFGHHRAVHVEVGDVVSAGEVLMELSPDSLESSIVQAEAELAAAEQDLDEILAGPSATDLAAAELRLANARDSVHDAEYNRTVLQQGNRASGDTIAAARASLVLARPRSPSEDDGDVSGNGERHRPPAPHPSGERRADRREDIELVPGAPERAALGAEVATAPRADAARGRRSCGTGRMPSICNARPSGQRPRHRGSGPFVAPFDGPSWSRVGGGTVDRTRRVTIADLSHYECR
jgi:hypothetical protein